MGRVLPGSKPTPTRIAGIPGPEGESDGGTPGLTDESTTSSTGTGSLLNAQTARLKYEAEQAAARAALERQQRGAQEQYAYLTRQLGAGIPSALSQAIESQQSTGEQYIADQARTLLEELQKRETASRGATTTGYSNLMNYLARTQPTAFAQAQRAQPQVVQSALGQYMAGQGVSPAVAQEAANIANVQAAGGAANYNQLLNVLTAREQAAQQSRQSEAEMGLSSALANLQGIYGAGTSQLEQQRLAALADLSSRVAANRFSAQQAQIARDQAVQDAIAQLIGSGVLPSGTGTGAPVVGGTGTVEINPFPPATVTPVQQLAAKLAGIQKPGLRQNIANFIASNPEASAADIQKKFPSLGKNIA